MFDNYIQNLDAEKEHPQIILEDAPYHYDVKVFNHCEDGGWALLSLDVWRDTHPSLITIPFESPLLYHLRLFIV